MPTFTHNKPYDNEPPIETERLFIKFFNDSDPTHYENIWSSYNDPTFVSQWTNLGVNTYKDLEARITGSAIPPFFCSKAAPPARSHYPIYLKTLTGEVGEYVGYCNVHIPLGAPEGTRPTIGYNILPAHQRKGYATEATKAMVKHCDEGLGMKEITASMSANHVISRRVAERAGGKLSDRSEKLVSSLKGGEGLVTYEWVFKDL